jgi:hypothetical protein
MDHQVSPKDLPQAQSLAAFNLPLLVLAAAAAILGLLFANPAAGVLGAARLPVGHPG